MPNYVAEKAEHNQAGHIRKRTSIRAMRVEITAIWRDQQAAAFANRRKVLICAQIYATPSLEYVKGLCIAVTKTYS